MPDGESTIKSLGLVVSARPSTRTFICFRNRLPVFLLNGGSAMYGYFKAFSTHSRTSSEVIGRSRLVVVPSSSRTNWMMFVILFQVNCGIYQSTNFSWVGS